MKKYNYILLLALIFYLLTAAAAWYGISRMNVKKEKTYRVEINRIYDSLSRGTSLDKLNLRLDEDIKKVSYLSAADMESEEAADKFYKEDGKYGMEFKPVFEGGRLAGIWRFDYEKPVFRVQAVLVYTEVCLAAMGVILTAFLIYIRQKVLKPFHRLNHISRELASGHLKGIVKEEKNEYFNSFLRGIGQLKDQLDVTKKRTLELEKEKKIMLLSLSHDIKTPVNMIKLYGKALEEEIYKEEREKIHAAHQIGEKAGEIERYVEEIMKNAREDILDIQVVNAEFYLGDLMEKVLKTYAEKCRIRVVDLKVGEYENCLLKGDLERSIEVFENIFENAFKYGDGRRIEISFYEEDYCRLIQIFNTGVPVRDTDFNHIFESFFRAAGSEKVKGNGLGLYICREIMRKMGGDIFARKQPDGMAFVLVFR